MDGKSFLAEIARRIRQNGGKVNDVAMANELGITSASVGTWKRKKELTPLQFGNLIRSAKKQASKDFAKTSIIPIVEFFYIDPIETKSGAKWEIFQPGKHSYLLGLKQKLCDARGIYIFYDSRGKAIYAGKTSKQTLWKELNDAFNRDRGDVQRIKRVDHPHSNIPFKTRNEQARRIRVENVPIHELASYVSVYEVAETLIGHIEAFITRAFANDLLNVKVENL